MTAMMEMMVDAALAAYLTIPLDQVREDGVACEIRYEMERAITAALDTQQKEKLLAILEATRQHKLGDPIKPTECIVDNCECPYWHSACCNKCGHVQAVNLERT